MVELEPSSDAEFEVTEPALPIDLEPGTGFDFEVTYCPQDIATNQGAVTVATFQPFETDRTIQLSGRGGGADLDCSPPAVDFGVVGVGASVSSVVTCENTGFEPAELAATFEDGQEFSLDSGPKLIDVGEVGTLVVVHSPQAPGDKQDVLLIESNDPDSPITRIDLTAQAVAVDPCTASLTPASQDLGLVSIGEEGSAIFTVSNTGASDCLIRSVRLDTTSPDFSIAEGPAPGAVVGPGEDISIRVAFAPRVGSVTSATLEVGFTNPGTTELTATVDASGGVTPVVVKPNIVDFGPTPVGCAAPG